MKDETILVLGGIAVLGGTALLFRKESSDVLSGAGQIAQGFGTVASEAGEVAGDISVVTGSLANLLNAGSNLGVDLLRFPRRAIICGRSLLSDIYSRTMGSSENPIS